MDNRQRLHRDDIIQKIHPNNQHLMPEEIVVKEVMPFDLIFHPNRFDVMLKYIYAKYWRLGIDSDWFQRLYIDHLGIIAPNYIEGDGSEKRGMLGFIESYNETLQSISEKGFDPDISVIPVNEDGVIIDGAHRLAACAAFYRKITVAGPANYHGHNYSASWFLDNEFPRKWADLAVTEYCMLNPNSYIAIVWPKAIGKDDEIRDILNSFGRVYYEKTISLHNNGPINLMKVVYADTPWIGNWKDGYSGAVSAASDYFDGNGIVRIFVFESLSLDHVLQAKTKIRSLFGIGNYSIHINDSHDETVKISQTLLNDNSIHFLNHANVREAKSFLALLPKFRGGLDENKASYNAFCIDSSMVLAAYGIREARDLDVLHHGYDDLFSKLDGGIGSHNTEKKNYPMSIDSVIYNPEYHFYTFGLKLATLDVMCQMKKRRGEDKDQRDILLVNKFFGERQIGLRHQSRSILFRRKHLYSLFKQFILRIPLMDKLVSFCLKR